MKLSSIALSMLSATVLGACATHEAKLTESAVFTVRGDVSTFTESDKVAITNTLTSIPELQGDEQKILWIEVHSSNSLTVYTGQLFGPLAGGGRLIQFVKTRRGWIPDRTKMIGFWNA